MTNMQVVFFYNRHEDEKQNSFGTATPVRPVKHKTK